MNRLVTVLGATACTLILTGCPFCPDCKEECKDEAAAAAAEPAVEATRTQSADLETAVQQQPDHDIDKSHKGNPNWRTWVVRGSDTDHMKVGDAFRIQKTGNSVHLKPLTELSSRWINVPPGGVALTKEAVNPSTGNYRFCGEVTVPHGDPNAHNQTHGIRVIYVEDDKLDVVFFLPDPDKNAPGYRTIEQLCVTNKAHGGTAHTEN